MAETMTGRKARRNGEQLHVEEHLRTPVSVATSSQQRIEAQVEAQMSNAQRIFHGEENQVSHEKTSQDKVCRPMQHSRRLRHPQRLVSCRDASDEESVSPATSSDSSCTPAIDTAFSHARGSWQADTLSEQTAAPRRFILLLPAHTLRLVRPGQRCSVLFAFDYMSKVLYEYLPYDQSCVVLWTPSEPTKNADIWTVLPLPPRMAQKDILFGGAFTRPLRIYVASRVFNEPAIGALRCNSICLRC